MWGERNCLRFETAVGGIEPPSVSSMTVQRSTSRPPLIQTNAQSTSAEHVFPLCRLFLEINLPVRDHCQIVCTGRLPRIFLVSVFLLFGFTTPVNNSGFKAVALSWSLERSFKLLRVHTRNIFATSQIIYVRLSSSNRQQC